MSFHFTFYMYIYNISSFLQLCSATRNANVIYLILQLDECFMKFAEFQFSASSTYFLYFYFSLFFLWGISLSQIVHLDAHPCETFWPVDGRIFV